MAQKDTYDFEAKREYRRLLREFVRKQYPKEKERRSLRVACLPGHEGLEVTEVYDPLGVPRHRIYGIEHDAEAARKLRALNLGINLYEGDAGDFFKDVQERFNLINLDFKSRIGDDQLKILFSIFQYKRFKPSLILGTNFFAARETRETQENIRSAVDSKELKQILSGGVVEPALKRVIESYGEASGEDDIFSAPLKKVRDRYTCGSIATVVGSPTVEEIVASLGPNLEVYVNEEHTGFSAADVRANPLKYWGFLLFLKKIDKINIRTVLEKFEPPLDVDFQKMIARYVSWNIGADRFFIDDFYKGSYNGRSGAPMFFDFINLRLRNDVFLNPAVTARNLGDGMVEISIGRSEEHRLKLTRFENLRQKLTEYYHSPRPAVEIKPSSAKIRADLDAGVPETEIMERYQISSMQLAGHKATLTRKKKEEDKQNETQK